MALKIDDSAHEAYSTVRKSGDGNDWVLLGYKDNSSLEVVGTGTGGANALKDKLSEDNCFFGYVRFKIEVEETTREKFALIRFKGQNASVMRKGKMSVHIESVKKVFKDFTVEMDFDDISEFSEDAVLTKIKSSNY